MNTINAILITPLDDVATTIVALAPGDAGLYAKDGVLQQTAIREAVPQYHKFAVRAIAAGEYVRKYGEVIGVATAKIEQGCHVHEHNIASPAAGPAGDRGEQA